LYCTYVLTSFVIGVEMFYDDDDDDDDDDTTG